MRSDYISQLNFTRFVAAMMIVIYHYGTETVPFTEPILRNIVGGGFQAITFFYVLSGFVLAITYKNFNKSWLSFMKRRWVRIIPLYWLGIIAILILGYIYFDSKPKGISIVLQSFGLHAWIPGKALEINYPGWSISVELFFYMLFPFINRIFKRTSTSHLLIIVSLIWILNQALHYSFKTGIIELNMTAPGQFMLYFPLFHLPSFLIGYAFGRLFLNQSFGFGGIGIIGLIVTIFLIQLDEVIHFGHNGLLAPLFGLMILSLSNSKSVITNIFKSKIAVFSGHISYSIYLLQFPVYILCSEAGFWPFVAILCVVSGLTYQFYELPLKRVFLRIMNK